MTVVGSLARVTALLAVVLVVTSMIAPTVVFAQSGVGNTSAVSIAGNTGFVDIGSQDDQTAADFGFRATEGVAFDTASNGEATVKIDVAGVGPQLSLVPGSAKITFARTVGIGNEAARTAVSVEQSDEQLTVSIDESDASLSLGRDLEVGLEADLAIADGATPSHTLSYRYVPASGEPLTQSIVLGASSSPALQGLPATLTPNSRTDLGLSGGGYPAVAVYARDNGDWQLLELDGSPAIQLDETDRASLAAVSMSEGDGPGNPLLATPGRFEIAVVGQQAGTTPDESLSVITGNVATAYRVTVVSQTQNPGAGTEANPYIINDVAGLQAMSADLDAHYRLGTDIEASATAGWNVLNGQARGFEPVGTSERPFTGSLDGAGHTIDGLTIQRDSANVGLFGVTRDAIITGMTLTAASVQARSTAGILAGELQSSTLESVRVTGELSGTSPVGGIAGHADLGEVTDVRSLVEVEGSRHVGGSFGSIDSTTLSNVSAAGAVTGTGNNRYPYGNVGGLVGITEGTAQLTDGRATGAVRGNGRAGGLVGRSTGKIKNGSATGTVRGGDAVGGLVGHSLGQIGNSTANGQIDGDERVGGLVGALGRIDPNKRAPELSVFVRESAATGNVDGDRYVGGLVGWRAQDATNDSSSASGIVTATGESGPVLGNDDQVAGWRGRLQQNADVLGQMDGSGTPADPYLIGGQRELVAMAADLGASYRLTTDIQLDSSATSVPAGERSGGFVPIGDKESQFSGDLDGAGHRISNLYIDRPDSVYQALFGQTNGSTIKDLRLENASVTGDSHAGLVAGQSENTRFENISVDGTVDTKWGSAGGIVGQVAGSRLENMSADVTLQGRVMVGGVAGHAGDTIIQDAHTSGTVTAVYTRAGGVSGNIYGDATLENVSSAARVKGGVVLGGLVGAAHGRVANSNASGDVSGTRSGNSNYRGVGGLVGTAYGRIEDSRATGDVEGVEHVGGLVGYGEGIVNRSTAEGAVTAETAVGGLVGTLEADSPRTPAEVRHSTAKGDVSGTDLVGGLVGARGEYAINTSSTSLGSVTGSERVGDRFGNDDQVALYIARQETNKGRLARMAGSGSRADPYIITDAGELQAIAADRSATYRLGADVDATGTAGWNGELGPAKGLAPIGETETPFTGTLDGDGHTITGLTIARADERYVGLFGYTDGATIRDLSLEDIEITGRTHVGGLIGEGSHNGRTIVSRVSLTGDVTARESDVGGVAGYLTRGTLTRVDTQLSVSGERAVGGLIGDGSINTVSKSAVSGMLEATTNGAVGGVAGRGSRLTVRETTIAGEISGGGDAGGVAGHMDFSSEIRDSTVTAEISGGDDTGGLVGRLESGSISESTATGAVAGRDRVGGLVGRLTEGSVEDSSSTGSVTGGTLVGGAIGQRARAAENSSLRATGQLTATGASGAILGNENQVAVWRLKDAARTEKLDSLDEAAEQEAAEPTPATPSVDDGGGAAGSPGGGGSNTGSVGGGGTAPTVPLPTSAPTPAPTGPENTTVPSANATEPVPSDAQNNTTELRPNATEPTPSQSSQDQPTTGERDSSTDVGSTGSEAQTPTAPPAPPGEDAEATAAPAGENESSVDRVMRVVSDLIGNVRQALFGQIL